MIHEAIKKIVGKEDLSYDEAYAVMNEIMSGETTPTQNAAFLAALSTKSTRAETIAEISGCAAAMRRHAVPLELPFDAFEIVGTGGDNSNSFNISTTSLFVLAAGGVKVAKHGNRSASSRCGTADCLEALGVNIDQPPELCRRLLERVGLCFMFAQRYHTSMKFVGPITNPARPKTQLLGVYDPLLVSPLAQVLANLGVERGMVVHGTDGLDEISISAPTEICEFRGRWYSSYRVAPEDFGLARGAKTDILGGTPEENARITLDILSGADRSPRRDIVLLNAGAGLYVTEKASSFAEGVKRAGDLIDSGAALAKLEEFRKESNG